MDAVVQNRTEGGTVCVCVSVRVRPFMVAVEEMRRKE